MDDGGSELKRRIQEFKESPGYKIHSEISGVRTSLRAVHKNRDELTEAIRVLRKEYVGIPSVDVASSTAERALEEVARRFENFLSSESGLVDYLRKHCQERYGRTGIGREIQSEVDKQFVYAVDHRVALGLRGVSTNIEVLQPPASLKLAKDSPYKLPVSQLLSWGAWREDQRKLLTSMTEDFDVEGFADRYYKELEGFCEWLWKKQAEEHSVELAQAEELRIRAKEQYDKVFPSG